MVGLHDERYELAAECLPSQGLRLVECEDAALGKHRDKVAIGDLADVLGGHDETPPSVDDLREVVPNLLAENRVDTGRRLVENEEIGLKDQSRGQHEPYVLTTRGLTGETVSEANAAIDQTDASLDRTVLLLRLIVVLAALAGAVVGLALIPVQRAMRHSAGAPSAPKERVDAALG